MRTRSLQLSLVAGAALFGLSACGSDSTSSNGGDAPTVSSPAEAPTTTTAPAAPGSDGGPTTEAPAAPDPSAPVVEILDVAAPVIGGDTFDLAALSGQPVALWFWAPT